jgi:hypothetical protein
LLEPPGFNPQYLKCDIPVSRFAFKRNACLYTVELLQQGAAGLHGLQNFGLTRDDLKKRGLSSKAIERVYRSMYVYTVGFHDILKEVFSHCEVGGGGAVQLLNPDLDTERSKALWFHNPERIKCVISWFHNLLCLKALWFQPLSR